MKNFSHEQSVKAAIPIKKMMDAAMELDSDYLTAALKEMRERHNFRESAAVLNPNPFLHNEQQDLNEAKLEQLELMLKLAENIDVIRNLSIKLEGAKGHANEMQKMFGGSF